MTYEELMQIELELEAKYKQAGYDALNRALTEAKEKGMVDTSTKVGQAFFHHKAYALQQAVTVWLEKNLKPKAGVKSPYVTLLYDMQEEWQDTKAIADMLTVSTMSLIINALCVNKELALVTNLGHILGREIEKEYITKAFDNWLKLPKQAESDNKNALYGIDKRVGKRYRQIYLKNAIEKCGFNNKKWQGKASEIGALGVCLLDLGQITGYYVIESRPYVQDYIVATPIFTEAWGRNEQHMLDLAFQTCPMVVPPAEWTALDDGGYYGKLSDFYEFLRLRNPDTIFAKSYRQKLEQIDMPMVYKAVNSLQATAWTINKDVLSVVKACRERGYIPCGKEGKERGYVILLDESGSPALPPEDAPEEVWKEYKKKKAEWYRLEKRRVSIQNRDNTIINTADEFSKYEKIYFPWNMDFRGRIYPIPSFSPQGDDLNKGLLLFADTPPCQDTKDIEYLAITGANLAGVDKVSYADRIQWVYDNEEYILASASDPMACQWWLHQDKKPVQLLAFCFEWAKAKAWIEAHGSIVGFTTGLPYAQDGTCSGLQHFSAILRDPIGGKAVNLVPQDKPNDIYAQVAEKVNIILKQDALNGTADEWDDKKLKMKYGTKTLAQIWLSRGVNRKVTKRPTMTLAYGARKQGFIDQILEDTIKADMDSQGNKCIFNISNRYACAQYMANLIWDAVGTTVVKAMEGMEWLHKCAKLVTKNANVVAWTTPLGLLLQQSYAKYESKAIQLRCAGKRYRIYVPHQVGDIDKAKQTNGIAPNFIHSMDACHLQWTVCLCVDAGVKHFTMVHDSYGCPMSQVKTMYDIVRQTFIDMYTEHDVFEEFRQCLQPLADKPLPEPPKHGTLDLSIVKDSKYIFC